MVAVEVVSLDVPPTRASRRTLAGLGTLGLLSFATYTNGADFLLLYLPPSTLLLALWLLQILVMLALAIIAACGEQLAVLPRVASATVAVVTAICATLALPVLAPSPTAASIVLCLLCSIMGAGNGVLQATSAGVAGASGPELLTAQATGVGIANLLMSIFRVAFKLALPGEIVLSYRWFVVAAALVSFGIVVHYVSVAKSDPHMKAVLRRRSERAAADFAARGATNPPRSRPSCDGATMSSCGETAAAAAAKQESLWATARGTGHYGVGQTMALAVALTVFPGVAFEQTSTLGLTDGWLPVLAVTVFNVFDFGMRVATAVFPCIARPSAAKHLALEMANLAAAAGVVYTATRGLPDYVSLACHAALATTSGWMINVCFVGADGRVASRVRDGLAPASARERTGTVMQGLILAGVVVGLSLSTAISSAGGFSRAA